MKDLNNNDSGMVLQKKDIIGNMYINSNDTLIIFC